MLNQFVKDQMASYYVKSEDVTKEVYKLDQVRANKQELLQDTLHAEILDYLTDLIPNNVSTVILQNVDYLSIVWEYIHKAGHGIVEYNHFTEVLCKDITASTVSEHGSKLNYRRSLNAILFLTLGVA